jgi:hypothetical protein
MEIPKSPDMSLRYNKGVEQHFLSLAGELS